MALPYSESESSVVQFLRQTSWHRLPQEVVVRARHCLLDLVGVAAGGFLTPQATIVREHAAREEAASGGARLIFDGRRVSSAAAAWANATAIESLDGHDGHSLTKGHAGVALLPALLAVSERPGVHLDDDELLLALVKGYELAIRFGIALHATVPDYHSSGSWNAVAGALVCSALLGGSDDELLHAAGIAEYFGPRGPMMRCIAAPSMVKDSSGWGSRVAVEAALLAAGGFTGRPAELLDTGVNPFRRSGREVADAALSDLGERWRILELYFKPHPVCRWAQPAVEAALALRREHQLSPEQVESIRVGSFSEAVALTTREPRDTEEAQYSLPYAVAAALRFGQLGGAELRGAALADAEVLRLSRGVSLVEVDAYNRRFPKERLADLSVRLRDGRLLEIEGATSRGEATSPLSEEELVEKFRLLCEPVLGEGAGLIEERILSLGTGAESRLEPLRELLLRAAPVQAAARREPAELAQSSR